MSFAKFLIGLVHRRWILHSYAESGKLLAIVGYLRYIDYFGEAVLKMLKMLAGKNVNFSCSRKTGKKFVGICLFSSSWLKNLHRVDVTGCEVANSTTASVL